MTTMMTTGTTTGTNDVARAMRALGAITQAARQESSKMQREYGVTLAQLVALQQLRERPAESVNDLAVRTGTHQSSVSVVMRQLEQAGLVNRSRGEDGRRVQFALTVAGRHIVETVPATVYNRLEGALSAMGAGLPEHLADLLTDWTRRAGL